MDYIIYLKSSLGHKIKFRYIPTSESNPKTASREPVLGTRTNGSKSSPTHSLIGSKSTYLEKTPILASCVKPLQLRIHGVPMKQAMKIDDRNSLKPDLAVSGRWRILLMVHIPRRNFGYGFFDQLANTWYYFLFSQHYFLRICFHYELQIC